MRKGGGLAMTHLDDRCQISKSAEKIAPTIVLELAFSVGFYDLSRLFHISSVYSNTHILLTLHNPGPTCPPHNHDDLSLEPQALCN